MRAAIRPRKFKVLAAIAMKLSPRELELKAQREAQAQRLQSGATVTNDTAADVPASWRAWLRVKRWREANREHFLAYQRQLMPPAPGGEAGTLNLGGALSGKWQRNGGWKCLQNLICVWLRQATKTGQYRQAGALTPTTASAST